MEKLQVLFRPDVVPPGHSALAGGTVQLRALPSCIVQGALPVVAALRAAEFDLGGGRESNPIRRNRILSGLIAAQPPGSAVLIAPDVKGIRQPRSSGSMFQLRVALRQLPTAAALQASDEIPGTVPGRNVELYVHVVRTDIHDCRRHLALAADFLQNRTT